MPNLFNLDSDSHQSNWPIGKEIGDGNLADYKDIGAGVGPIATDKANADQIAQRMDNDVKNSIRYFG